MPGHWHGSPESILACNNLTAYYVRWQVLCGKILRRVGQFVIPRLRRQLAMHAT